MKFSLIPIPFIRVVFAKDNMQTLQYMRQTPPPCPSAHTVFKAPGNNWNDDFFKGTLACVSPFVRIACHALALDN